MKYCGQRNWDFATNSGFIIIISFQPDVVDPRFFPTLNYVGSHNLSLKYQRVTASGCKDIKIRKKAFVAKTQFLYIYILSICVFFCKFLFLFSEFHFQEH